MRLLITSVLTIITLFFIGILLRFWGLSQPTPYYQSEFFKEEKPEIIALGGQASQEINSYSLAAYRQALAQNPNYILGAQVFLTKDNRFALMSEELAVGLGTGKFARQTNYEGLPGEPLLIQDFIREFPDQRFYIELHDNVHDIHEIFVEQLSSFELDERILIRSPFDLITRGIKELKPLWLYGSGSGEVTRFIALESMFLEPLMKFYSDVYVTQPKSSQGRLIINESIIDELHRRRRRIAVGPIDTDVDYAIIKDLDVDLIITHQPKWLESQLH